MGEMDGTAFQLNEKIQDLYQRALWVGYAREDAATFADCLENWTGWSDPCPAHPNHSQTLSRHGYAVEGCEACKVLQLSDESGYSLLAYAAKEEASRAEEATFQAGHEMLTLDSQSGIELLQEMLTLEIPTIGATPYVKPRSRAKGGKDRKESVRKVHLDDSGIASAACGRVADPADMTRIPQAVTCSKCRTTRRFHAFMDRIRLAEREREQMRQAEEALSAAGVTIMDTSEIVEALAGDVVAEDVSVEVSPTQRVYEGDVISFFQSGRWATVLRVEESEIVYRYVDGRYEHRLSITTLITGYTMGKVVVMMSSDPRFCAPTPKGN